jgi:SAM-dependent methyltransferase
MVTGIDITPAMLDFARDKTPDIPFACADATRLPFADHAFDHVVAVTSLCFVADEDRALREMARVARRRVTLGLLNRRSLLYRQKSGGNTSGYAGARWHSPAQARALLANASIGNIRLASALFLPSSGMVARATENRLPPSLPFGGFLAVSGQPPSDCQSGNRENRSR